MRLGGGAAHGRGAGSWAGRTHLLPSGLPLVREGLQLRRADPERRLPPPAGAPAAPGQPWELRTPDTVRGFAAPPCTHTGTIHQPRGLWVSSQAACK
jgi:hypothetical protein